MLVFWSDGKLDASGLVGFYLVFRVKHTDMMTMHEPEDTSSSVYVSMRNNLT